MRCRLWSCLLLSSIVACDSGSGDAPAPAVSAGDARPPVAAKDGKDRGHATVTLDGAPWAAERCSARIKAADGREQLTLQCSRSTAVDGHVQTEELKFVVKDYGGVGAYADVGNSHFTRVTVDTRAANAAPDDEARDAVVTSSIAGSKVVLITGASVSITAATGAAIDGTFAWTPAAGREGPTLADGRFHAVVK